MSHARYDQNVNGGSCKKKGMKDRPGQRNLPPPNAMPLCETPGIGPSCADMPSPGAPSAAADWGSAADMALPLVYRCGKNAPGVSGNSLVSLITQQRSLNEADMHV